MTSDVIVCWHLCRVRADRLLSLLWILRARGTVTAARAARELGVSTRTVLRDVESLSTAGVPVYCLPGRGGGIHLDPGFRTDVTGLTPDEAQALFAAMVRTGVRDLGWGDALDAARRKLSAALPAPTRDVVGRLDQRVLVDAGGWLPTRDLAHLDVLQHAVLADRRVRIEYRSSGAVTTHERRLDTYGLVCAGTTWYLAAAHDGRARFYHLARIASVEVLDEPSTRPDDLDLRDLWEESRRAFRSRFVPEVVEAFVRPSRIGQLLGLVERLELRPSTTPGSTVDRPPGFVRTVLFFADRSHAVEVLRGCGPDVLVVEPAALRETIVAEALAVYRAYESACDGRRPHAERDAGDRHRAAHEEPVGCVTHETQVHHHVES